MNAQGKINKKQLNYKKIFTIATCIFLLCIIVSVWFFEGFDNLCKLVIAIASAIGATTLIHYEEKQQVIEKNNGKIHLNNINNSSIEIKNDITDESKITALNEGEEIKKASK